VETTHLEILYHACFHEGQRIELEDDYLSILEMQLLHDVRMGLYKYNQKIANLEIGLPYSHPH
jgi:hypothetical protein